MRLSACAEEILGGGADPDAAIVALERAALPEVMGRTRPIVELLQRAKKLKKEQQKAEVASFEARFPTGDKLGEGSYGAVYEARNWDTGDAAAVINVIRKLRNAKDSFAGSSRPWVPGGGPLPGL